MRLIGALAPLLLLSAASADGNNKITVASIERSGTVDNNKNVQHLAEEQGQGKLRHLLKKLSLRMGVGVGVQGGVRQGQGEEKDGGAITESLPSLRGMVTSRGMTSNNSPANHDDSYQQH